MRVCSRERAWRLTFVPPPQDAVLIGQFGQAAEWDLEDRSKWASQKSVDLLEDILQGVISLFHNKHEEYVSDEEEDRDILLELDERLRKKPTSYVQFNVGVTRRQRPGLLQVLADTRDSKRR